MNESTGAGIRPAPRLALVVPCLNEERALPETMRRLHDVLADLSSRELVRNDSFALYVDDGSRDSTWTLIAARRQKDTTVAGVKLARTVGQQKALLAGMQAAHAVSDCVVSLDADLQDDESSIEEFVLRYCQGNDIVYGVRDCRASDTWFKRWSSGSFYRVARAMGIDLIPDHADYRLLSRRALSQLGRFEEVNLFLRGIIPLLGLPSACVYYQRRARVAGESKYSLARLFALAMEGITSFSVAPLRFIGAVGLTLAPLGLAGGVAALACWSAGLAIPGWVAILVSVWFLGGVQLAAVGLLGEYLGKTYQETKHRPLFVVEAQLEPRCLVNESSVVRPRGAL